MFLPSTLQQRIQSNTVKHHTDTFWQDVEYCYYREASIRASLSRTNNMPPVWTLIFSEKTRGYRPKDNHAQLESFELRIGKTIPVGTQWRSVADQRLPSSSDSGLSVWVWAIGEKSNPTSVMWELSGLAAQLVTVSTLTGHSVDLIW